MTVPEGAPKPLLYQNAGNAEVLALLPRSAKRVLDVGCGAGDNARLLRQRGHDVWGVTLSESEAQSARQHMQAVWVGNAEDLELPVADEFFDAVLMSHVLEHFARPDVVLRRFARYLRSGGLLVAAVPNMAHWRVRLKLLRGDWERFDTGPFNRTHLQFWSVATAESVLADTPFEVRSVAGGSPGVPLWPLRRIAAGLSRRLDSSIGKMAPNLFAQQVLLTGVRSAERERASA